MTSQIIPADPDNARTLARYANDIRSLRKRALSDIIEIGRMLIESKKLAGHGNWLSWLEREFQWTDDTALNYMRNTRDRGCGDARGAVGDGRHENYS
jgi:Protein of unknown function (DUF3102)